MNTSTEIYQHAVTLILCNSFYQVNRWNADVRGSEPCRSEGKVLLLASCHDTFPKPLAPPQVVWVTVKDLATVQRLRRAVCLGGGAQDLPVWSGPGERWKGEGARNAAEVMRA